MASDNVMPTVLFVFYAASFKTWQSWMCALHKTINTLSRGLKKKQRQLFRDFFEKITIITKWKSSLITESNLSDLRWRAIITFLQRQYFCSSTQHLEGTLTRFWLLSYSLYYSTGISGTNEKHPQWMAGCYCIHKKDWSLYIYTNSFVDVLYQKTSAAKTLKDNVYCFTIFFFYSSVVSTVWATRTYLEWYFLSNFK